MASLTLTVGTIEASVETTNVKAQALLTQFVAATGGDTNATAQAQADHVIEQIKKYIVDRAKDERRRALRVAADATNEAEIAGLEWE